MRYTDLAMPALSTNGLVPALGFPVASYEAVHAKVNSKWSTHALYEHYAGAWNALAYRFQGAVNAGESLASSFATHGASPIPQERFRQEHELFNFFSAGFSAFESSFYATFTIGAFLKPTDFPLHSPRDQQRVSPSQTVQAFKRAFPSDPLGDVFDALFADPAFQRWREVRNVLTHRTAPGRRIYVSIGADEEQPVEWKMNNIALDENLVPDRLNDLARLIDSVVAGIDVFLTNRI